MLCVSFTFHSKFSQLDIYLSKDDLIQKFLFAAVTGNGTHTSLVVCRGTAWLTPFLTIVPDEQHVGVFLIVYRRFARPYEWVARSDDRHTLTHLANHNRLLQCPERACRTLRILDLAFKLRLFAQQIRPNEVSLRYLDISTATQLRLTKCNLL